VEGVALMLLTYSAMRKDGTVITSSAEFEDIEELVQTLSASDLTLVSYRRQTWPGIARIMESLQPSVGRMEIVEFCESLGSMIGSGLPLLDSLETIRDTVGSKRLKKAIGEVISEISRGESLSGAFSHQGSVFPAILVFFSKIGEETGTIRDALTNTASYLRKIDAIVSQVKKAFIYPSFVMASMGCVMIFWLFYVLPRLVTTFQDMNVRLPDITLSLVRVVGFVQAYWYLTPVPLVLAAAGLFFVMKLDAARYVLTATAFRVPLVGDMLKSSMLTLLFSSLSLMLRSGLTLTRSLDILLKLHGNPLVRKVITSIKHATASGSSLLESFESTGFFDAVTLKMVSVGEKTGTLEGRLGYLADVYQEKTSRFVDAAGKMIEPMVMILSGGLFIFIVVSLIGPVYDLMSQLGGG